MAYSSIKVQSCKCGCGKPQTVSYGGYNYSCAPKDIFEKQKDKREASIKRSNAKKREAAKIKKLAVKTVIRPKRKPIARNSKKRLAELRIYTKLKKDFLLDNPICKCGINECKRVAVDVHHKAGRENGLLNVVEFWLPVARKCHSWIETHPIEAKELGLSLSRLK